MFIFEGHIRFNITRIFFPLYKGIRKNKQLPGETVALAMILVVSFETLFIYDKANIMSMEFRAKIFSTRENITLKSNKNPMVVYFN